MSCLKNLTQEVVPVLFSGYNERAILALCCFFQEHYVEFFVVAKSPDDIIYSSKYSERILFCRTSNIIDLSLFRSVVERMPRDKRPIFVPTSEYLNRFVLKHKNAISNQSWIIASVEASTYNHISDKATSFKWLSRSGMLLPSLIDRQSPTYPCVFKPKKNVVNGASFYPIICFDSVHNTIESHMIDYYYCQEYVDGRSFYLCGYICKNGRFDYFWQENHLQQAAGKSMLLCSTVSPPISNSSEILSDLYKQGYHGPVMIEMIESKDQFYFIEINPRFWGPLQLALDSSSSILHLFALDQGFLTDRDLHSQDRSISGLYDFQKYYSWLGGYDESTSLKRYPLAQNLSHQALIALLQHNDVLAKHIKT